MDVRELKPVEQTALLTAYARAMDGRAPRPILGDILAAQVVGKIDYDFARLGASPSVVALVALRARMLDDRIRAFTTQHRDAVVVDLGAGLSTAVFRVDPPPTVDWYAVDLPAIIRLREDLLPHRDRSHSVTASVVEPNWAATIPANRPTMVFADGLFAFLSEQAVITVLRSITIHFGSGVLAFNDYGPVNRMNRFAGKLATSRNPNSPHNQWKFPGFKDARTPETWNPDLELIEEASVMCEPQADLFPIGLRLASRLAVQVPAIARKGRILQYRF